MKNIKFIIFVIAVILTSSLFAQYPYEFEFLDRNMDYGIVYSTAVSANSTVFAACSFGGLRAYEIQNDEYVRIAQTGEEGAALDVAISKDKNTLEDNLSDIRIKLEGFNRRETRFLSEINDNKTKLDKFEKSLWNRTYLIWFVIICLMILNLIQFFM